MKPFLTIAICTFNRANLLPRALESVRNQTKTNVDLEILIVDNGSTDHTRDVVVAVQAEDGPCRSCRLPSVKVLASVGCSRVDEFGGDAELLAVEGEE